MSEDSLAKFYQNSKENLQIKLIKIVLKKKKVKTSDYMMLSDVNLPENEN